MGASASCQADKPGPEELKKVFRELSSECVCLVCHCPLYSPVSLCINGHGVCKGCQPQLRDSCPLCQQSYSSNRSVLLNSILEILPRKCKFVGCEEYVKQGDNHEKWCGFQPATCKVLLSCKWIGCGNNIVNHVKLKHSSFFRECYGLNWSYRSLNFKSKLNFNLPFRALGQFFWMNIYNDLQNNYLKITFTLVPSGSEVKSDMMVTLYFGDLSSVCILSQIYLTPENWLNKTDNSMIFATPSLVNVVNKNKILKLNVFVENVTAEA